MSSHEWEMLIRLLLAAFLGGIVGIERGSGDRPAGFRTHILVCAGAALFMLVSMYGYDDYTMHGEEFPRNRDSSRIAAPGSQWYRLFRRRYYYARRRYRTWFNNSCQLVDDFCDRLGCRCRYVYFKYCFYGCNDGDFGHFSQLGKAFCRQQ